MRGIIKRMNDSSKHKLNLSEKELALLEMLEEQLTFWKEQLRDITTLELPTDHPRPPVQTFHGATHSVQLPQELTKTLQGLSRKEGVTLFMTLLTAFQGLLHRYTGQDDIVVGTPIANRNREEIEGLIGFFVNTLVMRTDTSGNPVFRELLKQVRKSTLDAYANQDLPFEKLIMELHPERDLSRNPIFQVMFALQNAPVSTPELSGLTLSRMGIEDTITRFDLEVELSETAEGLKCTFVYNTDLFDRATIERMAGHYRMMLEGVAANPDQRLSELPLLTEAERHQLLVEWNNTSTEYPKDKCIHELFEEQVEKTPDAIAVVFEDKQLTYRELNAKANQLAHYLRRSGVGPEAMVGICVERSLEMIIGVLGILKAGGAYVPLDPVYPEERLAFMLEDAQASILITQTGPLERLHAKNIRAVCIGDDWGVISQESPENVAGGTGPDNLAYVIYTSGSTGRPKGVMVTHYNVVRLFESTHQWFYFNDEDVWTLFHSYAFDFSVWELWGALLYGGRLILVPFWVSRSLASFLDLLIRHKVTVLNITPSAFRHLIQEEKAFFREGGLALRLVIFGGEALQMNILKPWFDRHGDRHPQLVNMYGITETTVHVTYRPLLASDAREAVGSVIGRPIPDLKVHILDPYLQTVPIGVSGEIYVGGDGLARGYLNRPELTSERFIRNPFSEKDGSRLYRTGDLARFRPDGNIEFLGRIDHQVKIRGFRIELGEIESVLGQHPDVMETIVIAREDQPGDKCLVAYVTVNQGSTISPRELRNILKEKLPDYMVPSAFIILDALPLTPNGKVDRKALPEPDSDRPLVGNPFVGSRTPAEELLVVIWAEVLGLKQVGIYDNFFELGGHSLLATKIISRVREIFQVDLPVHLIFENPTVAELAGTITGVSFELKGYSFPPIIPINRDVDIPLSFSQERIWFINEFHTGILAYNFEAVLWFKGVLKVEILEKSLNEILRRHEIYRTTFPSKNGQPIQVIHKFSPMKLDVTDISSSKEDEREEMVRRMTVEEYMHQFDLSRLPLIYWKLVRLGPEEHVLIHIEHHLVHDGWSFNILLSELMELYNAFSAGKPSPLAEPQIQFSDFAYWQRQWMQGEVVEQQLSYWEKNLDGYIQGIDLPFDRPRPAVQTFNGKTRLVELHVDLCESIRSLSRRYGVSLYMTMLSAFLALIYRYTGKADICIGAGVANRRWRETEGIIGMVINTLALRTDLSGEPSFRELLKRVRDVCLGAYANQDIPFDKVVEAIQPQRSLSYSPLYQIMFSFHDSPLSELNFTGLKTVLIEGLSQAAKSDLNIIVIPRSEQSVGQGAANKNRGITLLWEYNTDLFDSATIERMVGHYETLLRSIEEDAGKQISELEILSESERHQILAKWNDTKTKYPGDKCIHQLFEVQVERTPDAIAVLVEDQQLTYRELNSRANQVAHYLRRLGVGPEVMVGICVKRSLEMIVGILGILKAGGAYVPLDPAYPRERLWFMIEETRALVLLTQKRLLSVLPEHGAIVCLDADWELICRNSSENLSSEVSTDHLAYVMYTSGSTGRPKGVSVIHKGVIRLVRETNYAELTPREVFMQFSPFSFDASTFEIWGCFLNGGKLVIYPAHTPSLDELGNFIREQRITTLWLTSALFHQMVDEQLDSLHGVKQMLTGGDVLSARHARNFLERQSDCRLINGYGPTENTTFTCCYQMTSPDHVGDSVLIGRPVSNTMVYILDQNLQPVPVGVIGELHVGGAGLAREYLNRPELTAEKFIPNPFSKEPGERLYKTGDHARYLPDGNIEFLGRVDHQVKIRGFRIELGEIEAVLALHPSVLETVVIAREDHLGDKQLVAYVVLNEKSAVTNHELRNFLSQKLPDYMVPASFVMLDSLPLTPNGKIDRRALPAPDSERPGAEDSYVAPRNSIEKVLAGIWCEILGLKEVGIHDNFFELGGHSLLATQVMSRLRNAFQIEIPLRCLFETPTVSGLAMALFHKAGEREKVEQRAALLLKVAELSEDEVNTMIAEQIREKDNKTNE